MRAFEQKKDGSFTLGRVWMIIEGDKADVLKVESILNRIWNNDGCGEDMADGQIGIGYVIDRSQKAEFMADYKSAKQSLKGGQ